VNISVIGAGKIGSTLCGLLVRAGHQVWVANTRGPGTLRELVEPLGRSAHAATVDEAASVSDLVVIATPLAAYAGLPAPLLTGKIVIDTGNYAPARDGHIAELDSDTTTSSERLAVALPSARVVKMFNTIYYEHLRDQPQATGSYGRRALPMAGDDPDAKRAVAALVDQIGFDTLDVGPLASGRQFQPGTAVYNVRLDAHELAGALDL
jgi:predicted dinucleotide-binding enzyme